MKKRKTRDSFEVLYSIMFVINKGRNKKTHILYGANLTIKTLMPKLEYLVEKGFVETYLDKAFLSKENVGVIPFNIEKRKRVKKRAIRYDLTDAGKILLRDFQRIHEKVPEMFNAFRSYDFVEVPAV